MGSHLYHPLESFSSGKCLQAIDVKEPQFAPGSKYLYTNTNYLLLSLPDDAIAGDHAARGCGLLYIPSHKVYVFLSTNFGCFADSKLSAKAGEMQDVILGMLIK